MDTLQLPKKREKIADKEGEERPQHSPISTSPPSASSSPSHEFSFTISLHPSSTTTTTTTPDKTKSQPPPPPPSFAIDLSPADDIFFHGHLLPLHLLSHLPVSPRSSTNSFESFNLPIKDVLEDCKPNSNSSSSSSSMSTTTSTTTNSNHSSSTGGSKGRNKLKLIKSLSLFGITKWQQKGCEVSERDEEDEDGEKKKKKRKIRFDVGHILKRYVRMVRPLLIFSNGRKENNKHQFLRQNHSFSGNLSSLRGNCKQERRGGRRGGGGQFSAPASMRNSPSNSGLLIATEINTSDSTMEELHNAIQAAIAHCKNSIAMKAEEKLKC
ncbi:BRI1 kinase inhibitor 1 [Telopea speciosissima]|uniref:BRI1 kinase inhibitor 1 n=1 Tax=Telopea speciosissima TaxID=54955 RepID=UPI001CC4A43A|nr:BRI1 kinase inhibitor 1 [Telopea speciosissima]